MRTIVVLITLFIYTNLAFAQPAANDNILLTVQSKSNEADGDIKIEQDERLSELLHKHAAINKSHKGMTGYRIQIYSGSASNSRKEADRVNAQFKRIFPALESNVVYEEPYYKTRVGHFRNKTEGYKTYKAISKHFPSCYFVIDVNMELPKLK